VSAEGAQVSRVSGAPPAVIGAGKGRDAYREIELVREMFVDETGNH